MHRFTALACFCTLYPLAAPSAQEGTTDTVQEVQGSDVRACPGGAKLTEDGSPTPRDRQTTLPAAANTGSRDACGPENRDERSRSAKRRQRRGSTMEAGKPCPGDPGRRCRRDRALKEALIGLVFAVFILCN